MKPFLEWKLRDILLRGIEFTSQHIDNDSRINPLLAAASAQRPLSLCQPLSARPWPHPL